MNKPVFLFVESNTSGTGEIFFRKVKELEIHPILLTSNPAQYHFMNPEIEFIVTDTSSEKTLLEVCRDISKQNNIVGITSSSDYFVETAAKLAKHFKLPGADPAAISACRNKEKQRLKLFKAGIGVPKYRRVVSVEDAADSAAETGFPVVLKPNTGSGSVGVTLCENLEEVIQQANYLLNQTINERGISQKNGILIEQYIAGDEYSVETFGKEIIGITKKHLGAEPFFVEIGHDFPASVSPETKAVISETVLKALKALNLEWGPSHTEVRVNDNGVFVIEVNSRLAGGFIPELIRYSFGIDLIAETISLALGRQIFLVPRSRFFSSIRFILSNQTGTLINVKGAEKANQLTGVEAVKMYIKTGEKILNFGDYRDRVGHVIARGKVSRLVSETAEKGRNFIQLTINSDK